MNAANWFAAHDSKLVSSGQTSRAVEEAGYIIWFTGYSGAGKSTLAERLKQELAQLGKPTCLLDGDVMRRGLCSDLGYTPHDRKENIRRVGEVAALFANTGIIAISAFISPYREDRDRVRSRVAPGRFIEVHVSTPLAICEQRDTKGLYAKARANQLPDFTGISAPYEPPLQPELTVDTTHLTVDQGVSQVLEFLLRPNVNA